MKRWRATGWQAWVVAIGVHGDRGDIRDIRHRRASDGRACGVVVGMAGDGGNMIVGPTTLIVGEEEYRVLPLGARHKSVHDRCDLLLPCQDGLA